MKKSLTLLFFVLCFSISMEAQQDPMFTKYMFNSLVFNPAYAGSTGYLSLNALYRNQWTGWGNRNSTIDKGAPLTQTFTGHMPFKKRLGLGLSLSNDVIGARNTTSANFAYAYRISFGKGKIAMGIQAGATYWRADWSRLNERDPNDPVFTSAPSAWIPNFGAGLYYHSKFFYAGLSVPQLLNYNLPFLGTRLPDNTNFARTYQHIYMTVGGAIPLYGPDFMLKPSLLVKSIGLLQDFGGNGTSITSPGAPTQIDLDVSIFLHQTLWIGLSFRTAVEAVFDGKSSVDSADLWVAYYLKKGIRIGAAYDFTLTSINQYSNGSFELMMGYDFQYSVARVKTPRYF